MHALLQKLFLISIKENNFFALQRPLLGRNDNYSWVRLYNREQRSLANSMSRIHTRVQALLQKLILIGKK
jgi:hypothetical protein